MTMAMMENSMCMILCVTIQRLDLFALNAGTCKLFMPPNSTMKTCTKTKNQQQQKNQKEINKKKLTKQSANLYNKKIKELSILQ